MKEFETEKAKLISDLEIAYKQNPEVKIIETLRKEVGNINSPSELNGGLSRIVIDSLDFKFKVGERIIEFEQFFLDKTNLIQSEELRQIAKHLKKKEIPITFWGKAWSNTRTDWIYFDTVLDLNGLKRKFNLSEHIKVHQNLDPKSGTESGFIDERTGEGLMGKLKKN